MCRFQLRESNVWVLSLLRSLQAQSHAGNASHGVFKEAFVDMPNLLYIKRTVRQQQRTTWLFQDLQRVQKQQHGTVVDG